MGKNENNENNVLFNLYFKPEWVVHFINQSTACQAEPVEALLHSGICVQERDATKAS